MNRLIIDNLNVNSMHFKDINTKKVDILIITVTKINNSFPLNQFVTSGYSKPYRLCRSRCAGRVIKNIRNDIPSKKLKFLNMPENMEKIFTETNFFKDCGCYPPSQRNQYFFNHLGNALDKFSQHYERFLLARVFNVYQSFFMSIMERI